MLPRILEKLTDDFAGLPGIGPKLAKRIAIYIAYNRNSVGNILSDDVLKAVTTIDECAMCGNMKNTDDSVCSICLAERDLNKVMVVETVLDLYTIEATGEYNGYYFVLGGLLSPVKGYSVQNLKLDRLESAIEERKSTEIILALANTLEGEATTAYLRNFLMQKSSNLSITQLAVGIPTGVNIEFLDKKTLKGALTSRS